MYVCVQVFPENRCIVKGVVGRNHVLVDLYYPVGGCAGCLWGKVPAVAAPAEKAERRETHMTKQVKGKGKSKADFIEHCRNLKEETA